MEGLLSLLRDSEVRSLGLASRPLKSCRDSEGFNAAAQRIAELFFCDCGLPYSTDAVTAPLPRQSGNVIRVTCPSCQGSGDLHIKGQVTLGHSKNSGPSVIREGERPREPYR